MSKPREGCAFSGLLVGLFCWSNHLLAQPQETAFEMRVFIPEHARHVMPEIHQPGVLPEQSVLAPFGASSADQRNPFFPTTTSSTSATSSRGSADLRG